MKYLATKIMITMTKIVKPSQIPTLQPSCVIAKMVATKAAIKRNYKLMSLAIMYRVSFTEVSFRGLKTLLPCYLLIKSNSLVCNPRSLCVLRYFSRAGK